MPSPAEEAAALGYPKGHPAELAAAKREETDKKEVNMPGKHRAHTPIVSQKQQGMMGAELARREKGQGPQMKGMTTAELKSHLHESAGKKLPVSTTRGKK